MCVLFILQDPPFGDAKAARRPPIQMEFGYRMEDALNKPQSSLKATILSSGEHTRPRVWQLAPAPTASAHSIGSGEEAKMWSAGAPTTTREARVLPRPQPFHRWARILGARVSSPGFRGRAHFLR